MDLSSSTRENAEPAMDTSTSEERGGEETEVLHSRNDTRESEGTDEMQDLTVDHTSSKSENFELNMDNKKYQERGELYDTRESKIVRDPVHGIIHLDKLAVKIIDTSYFQRLRNIKQLSFVDYVYPGATHTIFAHSIGVYHLACQIIKAIEAQPLPNDVRMSRSDKMCIRVAALCRGIGHGPFGRAYTRIATNIAQLEIKPKDISAALTEKMFRETDLKEHLGENDTDWDAHINLIKDLIKGNRGAMTPEQKKKQYMFQIVSDLDSGLYVSEWDYCNRDAVACGVSERFQYDRALSMARVVQIEESGVFVLGYCDYDALFLYNMFNARFTLYQKVYRHRVVVAVELMIRDVFRSVYEANKEEAETPIIDGDKVDFVPIKTIEDLQNSDKLDKFLELDDNILFKIRDSSAEQYKDAQDFIKKIQDRKFYKMIKDVPTEVLPGESQDKVNLKRKETKERAKKVVADIENEMKEKIIEIEEVVFNYGLGIKDPVGQFYFYSKGDETKGKRLSDCDASQIPSVRPSVFEECHHRVYYKPNGRMEPEDLRAIFELLWSDAEASGCDQPATPNI